jgi:hypothetical protein
LIQFPYLIDDLDRAKNPPLAFDLLLFLLKKLDLILQHPVLKNLRKFIEKLAQIY